MSMGVGGGRRPHVRLSRRLKAILKFVDRDGTTASFHPAGERAHHCSAGGPLPCHLSRLTHGVGGVLRQHGLGPSLAFHSSNHTGVTAGVYIHDSHWRFWVYKGDPTRVWFRCWSKVKRVSEDWADAVQGLFSTA